MAQQLKVSLLIEGDAALAKKAAAEAQAAIKGVTGTATEATRTLAAANDQAAAAQQRAQAAAGMRATEAAKGTALAAHEVTNLSRQFADLGVMLAMGQSPLMAMITQGPQIADIFGKRGLTGILGGVVAGIGSMLNPTMLALAGVTALGYGASLIFDAMTDDVKSLDDALDAHDATLKRVRATYGDLFGDVDKFAVRNALLTGALNRRDSATIAAVSRSEGDNFLDAVGRRPQTTTGRYSRFVVSPEFQPFGDQIRALNDSIDAGKPKFQEFFAAVDAAGAAGDTAMRKLADRLLILAEKAFEANELLREQEKILNRIAAGQRGFMIGQPEEQQFWDYDNRRRMGLLSGQQEFDAWRQGLTARTPAERAAAARAAEEARTVKDEPFEVRQQRIDLAGRKAELQAQHDLDEAQKGRIRSLDQVTAQQQLDIQLIGKTAGEAARMRFEFERLSQLREEAARRGITGSEEFQRVFGDEIELIRKAADEMGKLADEAARASLRHDIKFEYEQLFRSPTEQAIASRLRGTGIGMDSPEADALRQIERIKEVRGLVKGFWDDFQQGLDRGENFGEAFGNAFFNAFAKALEKRTEPIWDRLADQLLDGIDDLFGNLFGGRGGPDFKANTTLDALIGYGGAAPAGNVVRMPLAGIAADQNTPMSIFRNAIASIESLGSGDYSALGPWTKGDRAYGRYGVMGNNIGPWSREALGYALTRDQFLASPGLQDRIFDHRFGGYVDRYGAQGAASMWFSGRPDAPNVKDALGTSAPEYLRKFNRAIDGATGNLTGFGDGLGRFAKAVSGLPFPAAPGGGGAPGFAGSGLGWLANVFNSWSLSPGVTMDIFSHGVRGLFAEGGPTGPGGKHDVRGLVHANEFVFSAEATRHIGVDYLAALHEAGRKGRGFAEGGYAGPFPAGGWNGSQGAPLPPPTGPRPIVFEDRTGRGVRGTIQEEDDGNGGRRDRVVVEDMVAGALTRRGSSANRLLRSQGLGQKGPQR